ncbi:hypothetical protein FBR05_14420 [Deltaproteobacteria bacterium PRO3]|nr:hypothetical protein [Deltaproteobacteria bacterium PRO3]
MSPKIKLCKEAGCNNQQTTSGFCRLHYLKNWRKIQTDKKRKAAKNLNKYIESIVRSNPDRAQRALKDNLRDESTFERSMEEVFYGDSLREVMADLGYREDLDTMIGSIKIDEDF